jgi:hypothetical protein
MSAFHVLHPCPDISVTMDAPVPCTHLSLSLSRRRLRETSVRSRPKRRVLLRRGQLTVPVLSGGAPAAGRRQRRPQLSRLRMRLLGRRPAQLRESLLTLHERPAKQLIRGGLCGTLRPAIARALPTTPRRPPPPRARRHPATGNPSLCRYCASAGSTLVSTPAVEMPWRRHARTDLPQASRVPARHLIA